MPSTTLDIDLVSQRKDTGGCIIRWNDGRATVIAGLILFVPDRGSRNG